MIRQDRGTRIENEYAGVLAFADDLAIIDTSLERMKDNLTTFDELIVRYGM